MTFFDNIGFSQNNAWFASILFIFFTTVLFFLIPKYNKQKFASVPNVKFYYNFNRILYWLIILLPSLLPYTQKPEFIILSVLSISAGSLAYLITLYYFSISEYNKPVTEGIYKFSRHPLYLSFFIITLGFSFLTESYLELFFSIFYFLSSIKLMKEEEKICENIYGEEYIKYKKRVRMIL